MSILHQVYFINHINRMMTKTFLNINLSFSENDFNVVMNVFNDLRQNDLNDLFDRFVCAHDVMYLFSFYLSSRMIFKNDFCKCKTN